MASAIRSHERRRLRSSASAPAARRLVGIAVRSASTATLAPLSLSGSVSRADPELVTQIAEVPAPAWRHGRDALVERA
jgi:hypothetical protein